jgi:arginase family enzyme
MSLRAEQDWPSAAVWLASMGTGELAVLGAGGPRDVPALVRARLTSFSTYHSERDVDVGGVGVRDLGDLAMRPAETQVADALTRIDDITLLVVLGGDGSVALPSLLGLAGDDLTAWGLVSLDAHHDVTPYDAAIGGESTVRALVDAGLPGDQIVQVGIAGFANPAADRRWCEAQGIDVVTAAEVRFNSIEDVLVEALDRLALSVDHVFLDLDLAVLDRSFAPACPHSVPGGLWPRELFAAAFLAGRHPHVRAISIGGADASSDLASATIDAAALCLLNAAAGLRERLR